MAISSSVGMPITAGALLLISIALLNAAIGLYVYRRNTSAPMNRAFACTALAVSLWTLALAWGRIQPGLFAITIRAAFAAGALVPVGVLFFLEHFGPPGKPRILRLKVITLTGIAFSLL